ncbi:YqgE/AlgH family protein [Nocardioides yefusunii]|uniref:YqgE/AlgH family protein n=1 Tax=Nocardioides yefusunii TaxID=2500546 RepID=A0ABW1QW15_9ACTN|nr:YqgE/AlgH family protein [Nocardioides yefusunii]
MDVHPRHRPGPRVAPGMLLVASPAMTDENFVDTVVLILDVDDDGALGVVLNRPSPLLVATVMGEWAHLVAEPEVLFRGGPVGPDGAVALAMLRNGEHALAGGEEGFTSVLGPVGLLDLDTPLEDVGDSVVALRLFAGYAGWGPGQLQSEIDAGDWDLVPGEPQDVFGPESEHLWREVLRRQPGELAWRSTRPADPALN